MRITCPNCGAQYEVDDALIPEAGRDVQCSNCGKGWFQPKHPEPAVAESAEDVQTSPEDVTEAEEAEAVEAAGAGEHVAEDAEAAAPSPETVEPPEPEEAEPPEATGIAAEGEVPPRPPEPEPGPGEPETASTSEDDEPEEDDPVASPAPPVTPRKPDESVLSVLREEAEREIAQRRQEAGTIESQPDLGLSEPPQRRIGPSEGEIAAGAAVAASARRDLLPDIDEINSTLRPDADRGAAESGEADASVEGDRRRGFRMGFGLMLLLVAALVGLYLASGWLATAVPALEPFLVAYVAAANEFLAWIDGLLARGVDAMSG